MWIVASHGSLYTILFLFPRIRMIRRQFNIRHLFEAHNDSRILSAGLITLHQEGCVRRFLIG
jgi:hypothetical protein